MSSPGSRPAAAGAATIRHHLRVAVTGLVLLGTLVVLPTSCGHWAGGDAPPREPWLIASFLGEKDAVAADGPVFSAGAAFPVCLQGGCSRRGVARARALAARVAREARTSGDPDALHLSALVDLFTDPGVGKPLQRALSSLQTTATLSSHPAPVLADLAGAYLVRAERAHSPRDLLSAIEAAEEALEREPGNRVALFNRALALDRFGLAAEAARDWREYLEIDSTSGMAEQARHRLRGAARTASGSPSREPALDAAPATFAAYALADPQGARTFGWERLLGAWAGAVQAGAQGRADTLLQQAAVLGEALERRPGGDATLADAVRAIRAADAPGLRALAAAHREYAAGRALYDATDLGPSIPHFRAAARAAGSSPALRGWARLFLGSALVLLGDRAGEQAIGDVAAAADTLRHPALAARARWSLAATLFRSDRYELALEPALASARLFRRAGENEDEGTALGVLCDAQSSLGDMDEAYRTAFRALELLRPYRTSFRLHNLLFSIADVAASDGLHRAAVRVQDEGVDAAERNGNPSFVTEAYLSRARLLAAGGTFARAGRDVDAGQHELERVTRQDSRNWLEADLRVTRALAAPAADRAGAGAALDSAAALFSGRGSAWRAFSVVVSAAEARLAAGDVAGGTARMEAAMSMLEQRRDSIRMEPRRAAVFESAQGVVDRVVMLKVAAGKPAEALWYMDRGRASLAPVGHESPRRAGSISARPGEVAVEYALVADTLLAWTVVGRDVELSRTAVDTARLFRTIRQVRSLLERGSGGGEVEAGLSQLYTWLIRPLEPRLGRADTPLAIVADGELAAVPFAALRDVRRARYLAEDHPLRFTVSLQEDRRTPGRPRRVEADAVFVADPAFDAREHPGLPRLAAAADEARLIAAAYPRHRVLAGTQATRAAVEAALTGASLVHYAGHAVFDDERPERSYLVLAPTGGRAGTGTLTAAELARLRLSHAPVVVLAACQTVSSGRRRTGGFTGLAGALLAAGAGGVAGGLWEVDDARTRPLMIEFHRAYRASGDGPAALRDAQLRLIHSQDPALRSPATWAGFRYAGR
ncbi:MAG: CHAT domain-containing protein [Longimicrobiaceae bacterium]